MPGQYIEEEASKDTADPLDLEHRGLEVCALQATPTSGRCAPNPHQNFLQIENPGGPAHFCFMTLLHVRVLFHGPLDMARSISAW